MFLQVKKIIPYFLFSLKLHCNLIIFLQSYNESQTNEAYPLLNLNLTLPVSLL